MDQNRTADPPLTHKSGPSIAATVFNCPADVSVEGFKPGRLCDCMWVSFDPRERAICGLATVAGGRHC